MKMIPLDATLVRGSHGRVTDRVEDGPMIISSERSALHGAKSRLTELRKNLRDAPALSCFDHAIQVQEIPAQFAGQCLPYARLSSAHESNQKHAPV